MELPILAPALGYQLLRRNQLNVQGYLHNLFRVVVAILVYIAAVGTSLILRVTAEALVRSRVFVPPGWSLIAVVEALVHRHQIVGEYDTFFAVDGLKHDLVGQGL